MISGGGGRVCAAAGCGVAILDDHLMCRRHWFMVPKRIRDAIWATVDVGGREYAANVRAARDAVQQKELSRG